MGMVWREARPDDVGGGGGASMTTGSSGGGLGQSSGHQGRRLMNRRFRRRN